jgi:hypothetical protein
VRIRHLSEGRITSAMCRSAVNRALSSAVKHQPDLGSYAQTHPHPSDEQQSPHNPQSKSHPYKKCTTHHTQTSQSIARGAPLMNTSPPEHWQVSSLICSSTKGASRRAGSSCRVKDSDGTISNDKTTEYPLMQRPMFSAPSTPSLSLKGWPNR